MRLLLVLALLFTASATFAQDRFGDWVSQQLGFEPVYAQSIGWDMPEPSVRVTDPMFPVNGGASVIDTPETTAWLVGMSANPEDDDLAGMALVWSDGPFARVVQLVPAISQSGIVAFQTPRQIGVMDDFAAILADQMAPYAPGPVLARLSDSSDFAVGDSGRPGQCFQFSALYKSNDDLVALVVLFQSHLRDDADAPACGPLTS
ncbi:hypothetical protein [Yoonia sp.]|uniref:hypothetical protein n=1 Tax=Yoonia sp. TaxID=2212373 RepID=UPI0023B4E16E